MKRCAIGDLDRPWVYKVGHGGPWRAPGYCWVSSDFWYALQEYQAIRSPFPADSSVVMPESERWRRWAREIQAHSDGEATGTVLEFSGYRRGGVTERHIAWLGRPTFRRWGPFDRCVRYPIATALAWGLNRVATA